VRHILITAGKVTIRARLLSTPTADRIWEALPISAPVQTWGKEVYFRAPVSQALEPDARLIVSKGEIAFWPDGDSIAIGFGPTPISKRGEIRFTSKCNVWAVAIDDVDQLKGVYPGEEITVREDRPGKSAWRAARHPPPQQAMQAAICSGDEGPASG
jgi:hypothetical protein